MHEKNRANYQSKSHRKHNIISNQELIDVAVKPDGSCLVYHNHPNPQVKCFKQFIMVFIACSS